MVGSGRPSRLALGRQAKSWITSPSGQAWWQSTYLRVGLRPGASVAARFAALLDGCFSLAAAAGMETRLAGVNLAREEAYLHMVARGFHAAIQFVTMLWSASARRWPLSYEVSSSM